MTQVCHQIKDEKLQYDINREVAKISASSSGKMDKYEYLTGEEILSPNQIIEQAKFTYSPLEKASEKQTKTIADQRKKQVDALVALKPKEVKLKETKPNEYSDYFLNGVAKMRESFEPANFYNVTYNFKDSKILLVSFSNFKGPLNTFKSICTCDIALEDVQKEQIKLKSDLSYIKQGNTNNRSLEQIKTINNIENLYNLREEVVKMFNNYAKNMSKNIKTRRKRT